MISLRLLTAPKIKSIGKLLLLGLKSVGHFTLRQTRPNKAGLEWPSVRLYVGLRPSTKSFFDFGKLYSFVKAHLLKCFCYSLYGCEPWDLDSIVALMDSLLLGGMAWDEHYRIPFNAHSFLIPSLSCTLPLFEEICKRFARFLNKCSFSRSALHRSVTLISINFGCYNSLIYKNLCTVCKLFNWSIHDYISGRVCLSQRFSQLIIKVDSLLVKVLLLVLCLNC